MQEYSGANRRSHEFGMHEADISALKRRCSEKELILKNQSVKIATLEANVKEMYTFKKVAEHKLLELQAWKNKALGYLAGLVVLSALMADKVKSLLFP